MSREQAEQEVVRLADAWANAELHGDTALLERLLADDYTGIGPLGFLLIKQEWLARHDAGDLKYEAFTLDEVKASVYNNDAAVLTGRQAQQGPIAATASRISFASHWCLSINKGNSNW